jgi:hypothetical protein
VTEATGADGLGCPEFVEGSGEEPEDATTEKLCEVKNEATGDILQIPCSATIAPALVAGDEEVEALLEGDNVTAENVTVHCSKTKFGCCP